MMKHHISNNVYKSIFESNMDAILIISCEYKILDANPAADLLFGYSHDEIIKLSRSELVNTNEPNLSALLNELNIEDKAKGEITFIKKDSSKFPAEISAIRLVDENDKQILMNIRDITDHKRVEESLLETNIKLDAVIGSMNDAVFISDVKGNFIDFNEAFATYHRFKNKEECYKTLKDFTDYIDVYFDDGTLAPLDMWAVPRALRGEKVSNAEYILRRKDTSEIWWGSYSFGPIHDNDGAIIGSVVVGHEITHRKRAQKALQESEEKYRNIVENIQDAYIRADKEGKIIMVSPSAAKMYSFNFTLEMIGLSIMSFYLKPEDRDYVLDELKKHGKLEDIEAEAVRKDGTVFWVSQNVQYYHDEDGQIQGTETFVRDITHRKKVEETLSVSEENYRHLVQYAPTSIYEIDYNGPRFKSVNDAMCQFSGYSREELLSMNPFDMLDSESREIFRNRISEGLAGEKIAENVDFKVLHKDGHKLWASLNVKPTYTDGKLDGALVVGYDITKRKKLEEKRQKLFEQVQLINEELEASNEELQSTTEELRVANEELQQQEYELLNINQALRESELRHRRFYESGLLGVIYWNTDGNIIDANDKFLEMIGYTREELESGRIDWAKMTPPEYQYLDERSLIELKASGVNKMPFEKEYIRKDGSHIPIIVAGAMLDKARINGVAFVLDITERKKAETELKKYREQLENLVEARTSELEDAYESLKEKENQYLTLFNSIDEGFCTVEVIFDADDKPIDYRFLEINPAFEGQTGLIEAEGKLMRDLAPDHEEHWFEIYGKIALTGKPMRFVNEAKALNRWYDVYAFKIGDPEGREVAILFNDITKRKKAEDELKEYQDTLEEKVEKRTQDLLKSNKELEQFAYVSSHDLQEPIRMVTSFTQLLERRYKGQLDAEADDYINFIVEGAHRMKYLIDDLLAFSRLNTQSKEFENVDLETVLDDVISNLTVSIKENNALITHDPLPTVTADESQMMQVFQNLIVNAIKFHGPNPPKIHITTQKDEKECTFSVIDNGIGIDPQYQKQIFEVFKRLHTREEYPGSGIGLAVSQKIIQRHGGRIWVESEIGKGSTFYFTIPDKLNNREEDNESKS
jgi:PAS domain S-box-containing protein